MFVNFCQFCLIYPHWFSVWAELALLKVGKKLGCPFPLENTVCLIHVPLNKLLPQFFWAVHIWHIPDKKLANFILPPLRKSLNMATVFYKSHYSTRMLKLSSPWLPTIPDVIIESLIVEIIIIDVKKIWNPILL